jgi:hypothetical protein
MRLISLEEFDRDWRTLYYRVFTGGRVAEGCFQNAAWTAVLVPYIVGFLEEGTHQALVHATTSVGDDCLVVTDIEGRPPHQETALIGWNWEDLKQLASGTRLTVCDAAFFGTSIRWGGLSMQSEDGYTCIGGDDAFMSEFVAAAGGEQRLKERFAKFAQKEWFLAEERKQKILRAVGW